MSRALAFAALAALTAGCETMSEDGVASVDDGSPAERARGVAVETAADLIGLSESMVSRALGAPDRSRPEGDVAVWRYDTDVCILEMFFYPDGDARSVRFAEARDALGGAADETACLEALQDRESLTS